MAAPFSRAPALRLPINGVFRRGGCEYTHSPSFIRSLSSTSKLRSELTEEIKSLDPSTTPPPPPPSSTTTTQSAFTPYTDSTPTSNLDRSRSRSQSSPRLDQSKKAVQERRLRGLRVVPASPAYFTRRPTFMDDCNGLQSLVQKYKNLPRLSATEAPPVLWKSRQIYQAGVPSEPVGDSEFRPMIGHLQNLNRIHPSVMPAEIPEILNAFKRVVSPYDTAKVPLTLDSWGRALGVGYRKTSSARAFVVEGEGEVMINSKPVHEMFQQPRLRDTALWPLTITQRLDKYNVWAVVEGGGTTGQSTAVAMAIAKALLIHEPGLKPHLRKADLITRDVREVERKKPGHLKARKMPTWVKR